MPADRLDLLFSEEQIQARIAELARKIDQDFPQQKGSAQLWLIAALKGACFFQADLARAIERHASLGFVRASSYGAGSSSTGNVRILTELDDNITGADVILVEDIVDTGRTANVLLDYLAQRNPRTLRLAAMLDKPSRREVPVSIDYRGFEIPDHFVVGYGLDHAERFRNKREIFVLHC